MKRDFVKDLSQGHGHKPEINPKYNKGLGRVIRRAVDFEDDLDELDSLPKRTGGKALFGCDTREASYHWNAQNRWLQAQVGRPYDDIAADVARQTKGNNPAARRFRDQIFEHSWKQLTIRGELKVILNKYGYYSIHLVNEDETHTYDFYMRQANTLYVNLKGILCVVPNKLVEQVDTMNKALKSEAALNKIKVLNGHNYYKLNGAWQELALSTTSLKYTYDTLYNPVCRLCERLNVNWFNMGHKIGLTRGQVCVSMRTLSKKEVKQLLLDVEQ